MERVTSASLGWLPLNEVLRRVTSLGISSLLAGIVIGGVGGRLVMTISARAGGEEVFGRITENGNTIGQFTVGGTLTLVIFVGLLGGIVAGVAVVASDPWLRWAGSFRGAGYGLAVLAIFGHDTFDSVDFRILEPTLLNVAMFITLMVLFGYAVAWFEKILDNRLRPATSTPQVSYLLIASLAVIPLLLAILFFTSTSFCGCIPFAGVGMALLILVLATGIHHLHTVTDWVPPWLGRGADVVGYLAFAVALVLGLGRVWGDIQTLF